MSETPTPEVTLDWHQSRRGQGIVTLGVLVGPVGPGVRAWRRWAVSTGRPVVHLSAGHPVDALRGWLAVAFEEGEPSEPARAWVHRVAGRRPEPRTRYDLDTLWRTLPIDPTRPVAVVAQHLLAATIDDRPADLSRLADPSVVLAGVCGLLPADRQPALLLTPPPDADARNWFPAAAGWLEGWAVTVPQLPLAVSVSADGFAAVVRPDDAGRTATLVREGRVSVPEVTADELAARLRAAGVAPPPAQSIAALTADGLTTEAADAFVATAAAADRADPADDCRSQAERFLFEQLEALPETAGLFRPNRPLPFRHGSRPAEADLLASSLKIVVEVDGTYYHLNQKQYRTDRRKDWQYQKHGYLVLRFLAEDMVTELADILTTVRDAVRFRRPLPEVPADA